MTFPIASVIKETFSFFKDWLKYPIERLAKKIEHDKALYLEVTNIISTDLMREFFESLGYNRYENKHLTAIIAYFRFCKRADKYFMDKKIRTAKDSFDTALDNLLDFLATHFFVPHSPPNATFYALYPDKDNYAKTPEDSDRFYRMFKQREKELDSLSNKAEETYGNFIETVKKRLII